MKCTLKSVVKYSRTTVFLAGIRNFVGNEYEDREKEGK
jgi:hypothetical protein